MWWWVIEELGDRDTDLADVAFSKDTIRTVVNIFPYKDFGWVGDSGM